MSELFGGINPMQRALDFHLRRHNVIASNVANVDTPGFRPLELTRDKTEKLAPTMPLESTSAGHIPLSAERPDDFDAVEERVVRPGADGNSVSIDREMSKLAANDLRYDGAARIVARQLAMLRYAANDGQGG